MKSNTLNSGFRPRMIAERKPMRPVQIASARSPIKVTKPMGHGVETIPTRARQL